MVCVIALGMTICSSGISATQFAIYMSVANLGHAAGSKIYGMVSDGANYADTYMLISLFVAVAIVVLFFHRDADESASPAKHTIAFGGTEGGVFFSAAMRCPKCRTEMEQVDYDGIEIDRCKYCKGIWFDAGEREALNNKSAALAIDTGDVRSGREFNKKDNYRCPRCSGGMVRVVDPQQTHIWYETCSSCSGSYFDAGEFSDLAQHTISDFFKRFSIKERR
jgi:Zn-finger nucleic acid-binding protein